MIGYVKHLQPTEFVWSGTFGCSACARKIDYTAIYVIKFYSFIYIDINSAKDLDFYEMFSGCGSLYQEFRPVLSDIYTIHVYYQQLNIYIYINLGKNGMAALGPKWLTVFLYILMFIYIYIPNSCCRQWYDKLQRGDSNDLTTMVGLIIAVRDTLRVREGGLMHGGHPCNGCLGLCIPTKFYC